MPNFKFRLGAKNNDFAPENVFILQAKLLLIGRGDWLPIYAPLVERYFLQSPIVAKTFIVPGLVQREANLERVPLIGRVEKSKPFVVFVEFPS